MDRSTLLAHREQFAVEPNPAEAELEGLNPDEAGLYRDLIEDRFGPSVRLEQERIRFSIIRNALEPWLHTRSGAVSPDVGPASPTP